MSAADRLRWDTLYREIAEKDYPHPDPLLFQFVPPLRESGSACALDLACGVGQNGLWLAEQGYVVDLIDVSRVALTRAQSEAGQRSLRSINFLPLDLDSAELPAENYHLICVIRYLNRDLLSQIRAAIKPGGRIIYQTFNTRYLAVRPNMNPAYLLNLGELAGFFGDWKILHTSEYQYVSQIVAVKPDEAD